MPATTVWECLRGAPTPLPKNTRIPGEEPARFAKTVVFRSGSGSTDFRAFARLQTRPDFDSRKRAVERAL
jgi:hypothetical protein